MNICLFTSTFLPKTGGLENVVDTLARCYIAAGHRVVVLAKTPRGMKTPPQFDYPVYYYKRSRSEIWFLGSPKKFLKKLHEQFHFDVIHAHQMYPTGWLAVRFAAKYGIHAVLTSHVGDIHDGSRYRKSPFIMRRIMEAMRNADAVTGVGSGICRTINGLLGTEKALLIENGCVEPPPAEPSEHLKEILEKLKLNSGFDLTVCRLHPNKGLNFLIDACALMKKRGVKFPQIVMAGAGQAEESLRIQIETLGLAGQVHLIGNVIPSDRDYLLQHCRFFVQPSLVEGMPLTVLESLSAGVPVIATAIPGVVEIMRDGWNGRLASPGSPESLADIYAELNDEKRNEYALHAREILKTHSWERIANLYLELFRNILQSKRKDSK